MQDSDTLIGRDTQSISIVTSDDNNSHVSAQIPDMLAEFLSTLSVIKGQNAKANWQLGVKLTAENRELADTLTEQLQYSKK
jgi:hypothetical protein